MWKVIKKNKKYDKRKLVIYLDDKKIVEATPWGGWFCWNANFDDELTWATCRYKVLQNLHWLIGEDCDDFTWAMQIDKWDRGKGVDGKTEKYSQFFNIDEKIAALESFNK